MLIIGLVGIAILLALVPRDTGEVALEDFQTEIENACKTGDEKSGSIFVPAGSTIKIQQDRIEIEGQQGFPLECQLTVEQCTITSIEGAENIEFNITTTNNVVSLEGTGIKCA